MKYIYNKLTYLYAIIVMIILTILEEYMSQKNTNKDLNTHGDIV